MLDLGKLAQNYYEIKTIEGEVLQIKKPSQALLNKMVELDEIKNKPTKVVNAVYEILLEVLNNNVNGKEYSKEYVSHFDFAVANLVLGDYLQFTMNQLGE